MKGINWSDHILNFLAVIIGVSMAFYVSDTADKNKESEELENIIQSFIDELQEDRKVYLDYQIPENEQQTKLIWDVLTRIGEKRSDSLPGKIQQSLAINNYSPAGVTFNSLVSSGKLDLLSDFELRKEISTYYQLLSKEAESRGQLQVDFYMDQVLPWIINENDMMNISMSDVMNDTKLSNILILYRSLVDNKTRQYKVIAKESEELEERLKSMYNE